MHNEILNMLHNKIYWKICALVLLNRWKIKLTPELSIQAISREIPLTWKNKLLYQKCNIIHVHFLLHFLLHYLLH